MKNLSRRKFLDLGKRVLAIIPLVNVIGCIKDQSSELNPEDSLKRLIFIIGPWPLEEKSIAADFANRLLKAKHNVSQHLPTSANIIQRLTARFSMDDYAVKEINMDNLPSEEKDLLLALTKQLYNIMEVRFYISGALPWGQCIGDPLWHTKAPE